jgi:hypothetical protein
MDNEAYERRRREIAEHAESEGAWYYDPESAVIWKRYIIGPVPLWRRLLWWIFPPSHAKMRRIMQRRSDQMWKDATGFMTGSNEPTTGKMMGVILLGLLVPIVLSVVGPIYYGYNNGPYWRVIVWALACTLGFLWLARSSLRETLLAAPPSIIGRSLPVVAIIAMIAVAVIVGDSLVYLFVRSLSHR